MSDKLVTLVERQTLMLKCCAMDGNRSNQEFLRSLLRRGDFSLSVRDADEDIIEKKVELFVSFGECQLVIHCGGII
jgi:hypothetical protein